MNFHNSRSSQPQLGIMESEQMGQKVCSLEYINEDVNISQVGENDMPF